MLRTFAPSKMRRAFAHVGDETLQVLLIAAVGRSVAFGGILLLVVVAELDQHEIAGRELRQKLLPPFFSDETSGAAPADREVDDPHIGRAEFLKHLPPAGPVSRAVPVFDRGIPGDENFARGVRFQGEVAEDDVFADGSGHRLNPA